MRISLNYYTDPDPGSGNSPFGSKENIITIIFLKKIPFLLGLFHNLSYISIIFE